MKLSDYIKRLQELQREAKKAGNADPDVAIGRYSDFTTNLSTDESTYPRLIEGVRVKFGAYGEEIRTESWITREHRSMHPGEKRELFVELAQGN